MKNSEVIGELENVIAELQKQYPYPVRTAALIARIIDRLKEDIKVIEYLENRMKEIKEQESWATFTVGAYIEVIHDIKSRIEGGMKWKISLKN